MAVDNRNAYGAVCIADGGTPRIITVKARANISGGYWVAGSSALGVVSSGASSYAASDIEGFILPNVLGSNCIGLALTDIASGTYGPVAMRGIFLIPGGSDYIGSMVVAGEYVIAGTPGVIFATGSSTINYPLTSVIGRAVSSANGGLGQYAAISLNI